MIGLRLTLEPPADWSEEDVVRRRDDLADAIKLVAHASRGVRCKTLRANADRVLRELRTIVEAAATDASLRTTEGG